jgi:hypothetical protein
VDLVGLLHRHLEHHLHRKDLGIRRIHLPLGHLLGLVRLVHHIYLVFLEDQLDLMALVR